MKLSIFYILSFLFAFGQWQVFTSEQGRFSILAPSSFQESQKTIHTELGEISYNTFYCSFEQDSTVSNFAYAISYCDYPEESIPKDSLDLRQMFFQNSIESAGENLGAQIIYKENIKHKGQDGMMARLEYAEGQAVMKTKVFLVGNRFYSLQVFMIKNNSLNKDADRFLESIIFL